MLYDLSFTLKAVKCVEEKTKEAAAHEVKDYPHRVRGIHHRNSETVLEIAGFFLYLLKALHRFFRIHMCLYT